MASDYKKMVVRTVPSTSGDADVSRETQFWKNFEVRMSHVHMYVSLAMLISDAAVLHVVLCPLYM